MSSPVPFSTPPQVDGPDEPFSAAPTATDSTPFATVPRLDPIPSDDRGVSRRITAALSSGVILVVCVLLGFSLWETRISGWLAERAQDELRNEFSQVALATEKIIPINPGVQAPDVRQVAPSAKSVRVEPQLPAVGELVGRLRIPAIELDWMIVAGTDGKTLKKGPGAWIYGAFPGAPGNATLSGHRTTYGGPFRRLGDLKIDDLIYFSAPDGKESVFKVRGMGVVSPKDVYVTEDVPGVRLTLLTCDPPGTTTRRLVIQSELISGEFIDLALPDDEWEFLGK